MSHFRDGVRWKKRQAGRKEDRYRGGEGGVDLSVEVIELLPRKNQRS